MDTTPKWHRRKEARPAEIIEAGLSVFIENGFAAAKLSDVAKKAGIAKGTLYRYFDTKEDLFHAVVEHAISVNLAAMENAAQAFHGSLRELVPVMLIGTAGRVGDSGLPALARLVIGESRIFPHLARIWHDDVVARILKLLTDLIREAQDRNEVRAGDPTIHALSIMGPLLAGFLFHEVFGNSSPYSPDLMKLADQHAETVLRGIMNPIHEASA